MDAAVVAHATDTTALLAHRIAAVLPVLGTGLSATPLIPLPAKTLSTLEPVGRLQSADALRIRLQDRRGRRRLRALPASAACFRVRGLPA